MEHLNWMHCPSEILIDIFETFDIATLTSCMHVCKKWRDIAHYVAEAGGLWQNIVEQTTMDDGVTYTTKSKLDWKEIYYNSKLWHVTEKANIIIKSLGRKIVKNVHVYKDNLIVVFDDNVKYFDIETLNQRKEISIKCDYYEESDHMIILCTIDTNDNWYCNLLVDIYSKTHPEDIPKREKISELEIVSMYKLQGNRCCFISWRSKICIVEWDAVECKLVLKCLGQMYNLNVLHIHRNELYVMHESGAVYQYDTTKMGVPEKIFTFDIPPDAIRTMVFMFTKNSAVIRVPPVNDFKANRGEKLDSLLLECPALSCAMVHGNILLLGYSDGRVHVVNPKKFSSNGGVPELELHVQSMDPSIEQPEIQKLDVYETNYAHHLVVGTQCRVFIVRMKYPENSALDGVLGA